MYSKLFLTILLLIILLLITVLVIVYQIPEYIEYNYLQKSLCNNKFSNSKNITILLTCTVITNSSINYLNQSDYKERIDTYIKSIKNWLTNTNFNIVIVENSNYNFNELDDLKKIYKNRFEIISFDEKNIKNFNNILNSSSKGDHELLAINYAYNNSNFIKNSKLLFKITGRYYVPELEGLINSINIDDYDYFIQYNKINCEIIGTSILNFYKLFKIENKQLDQFIEYEYKKRIRADNSKIFILPIFKIKPTIQGGTGFIKNFI